MAILAPLLLFLKSAPTPGLVSSFLLSLAFVFFRKVRPLCSYLPSNEENDECTFDWVPYVNNTFCV